MVKKDGPIGRTILATVAETNAAEDSAPSAPEIPDDMIVNLKTGRLVKKTGAIGKALLAATI